MDVAVLFRNELVLTPKIHQNRFRTIHLIGM